MLAMRGSTVILSNSGVDLVRKLAGETVAENGYIVFYESR